MRQTTLYVRVMENVYRPLSNVTVLLTVQTALMRWGVRNIVSVVIGVNY